VFCTKKQSREFYCIVYYDGVNEDVLDNSLTMWHDG
jgi:hypothetical protein